MQLEKLAERVFYIAGPGNVGVVMLENSRVALIDSGVDRRYAEKLFGLLNDYRFKIELIINTHAHADHIGGNAFFQQKTGCRILASALEAPLVRQPLIQAAVLFAGAPIIELTNRFIMADPSRVEALSESDEMLAQYGLELIDLPGHSVNQKGVSVDGVMFFADSLFPESFFKKQRLPFIYDPFAQLETLDKLRKIKSSLYVGGHSGPVKDIGAMIELNASVIKDSLDFLRTTLKVPQPQDRVVKIFMDHFGLKKNNWEYFLYRATVNGYLSSLYKHKEIGFRVLDNLVVWYAN